MNKSIFTQEISANAQNVSANAQKVSANAQKVSASAQNVFASAQNVSASAQNVSALAVLLVAAAIAGCKSGDNEKAGASHYFASDQAWTFGNQTWSDAVHCPECDKKTFEESDTEPQCRSYTNSETGKTYYYYNWPYVNANKAVMCPSPWRVPTKTDFEDLTSYLSGETQTTLNTFGAVWGYGGFALPDRIRGVYHATRYWSSDADERYPKFAISCITIWGHTGWHYNDRFAGLQVRCVKDKS
ncbi:MAG: hypothetical protein LBT49_06220 [Prevotellaceae bacterium]|jgi:uncharacterized protein (TIGR02145 family)|nr:hypothetical protein [Prevotellaceae bacterium]